MEKLKEYAFFVLVLIAIVAVALFAQKCSLEQHAAEQKKHLEQAMTALNDSIHKVVNKNGDTTFQQKSVSFNLNELTKTDFFKQQTVEKQQFYKDLQATKGLLAAAYAKIEKQDSIVADLKYGKGAIKTDSTVCIHFGDSIDIPKKTEKNLTYQGKLMFFKEEPKLALKYTYEATIKTTYVRAKDGSINLTYALNDPDAKIVQGYSYMIPKEEVAKLSFGQKVAKFFVATGKNTIIFGVGAAIGYGVGRTLK